MNITDNKFQDLDNFTFPKIDDFLYKRQDLFFYISLFLLILFGILLFDVKVSEGTDDSMYLLDAKKFIEGKAFPLFHGAFYTIMIGLFMKVVGFHLIFFKILSLIFLIGHHFYFYYTFRNRISPFLLISVLFILCLNSSLIYFGSQTYTETFYMFLQALFFYIFIKHFYIVPNTFGHIRTFWFHYVTLGFLLFILSATRNVGFGALFIVWIYFAIEKKYIPLLYSFIGYILFKIPFALYKKYVWGIVGSDLMTQINLALQKDPYNKILGNESLSGLFVRIFENLNIYLSKIFLRILQIRDMESNETNWLISLIIISVLIIGLILTLRTSKKTLIPCFMYLGISFAITFISLHQMWSQTRLLIIFIPLILICLFWTISILSNYSFLGFLKVILIVFIAFIILVEFVDISKKVKVHKKILAKNINGDKYFGYSPDMVNFLRVSEWSAEKIPNNVLIGSRRASMSFIYGNGREFYPIFKLPFENVDSVFSVAKSSHNILYFINDSEIIKKQSTLTFPIKKFFFAAIVFENSVYGLYVVSNKEKLNFEQLVSEIGISQALSFEDFKNNVLKKEKETSALVPDNILRNYKNNNVHYLITASLRYDSKKKTDLTINTVERSMAAISLKYPNIFTKIIQIGKNNEEPAALYRIDYKKYNFQ